MKIEVLGTGCAKCRKLERLVTNVVAETGVDAEIVKVEKIEEILEYGVPFTPALVIEGEVKSAGGIPRPEQIRAWLKEVRSGVQRASTDDT